MISHTTTYGYAGSNNGPVIIVPVDGNGGDGGNSNGNNDSRSHDGDESQQQEKQEQQHKFTSFDATETKDGPWPSCVNKSGITCKEWIEMKYIDALSEESGESLSHLFSDNSKGIDEIMNDITPNIRLLSDKLMNVAACRQDNINIFVNEETHIVTHIPYHGCMFTLRASPTTTIASNTASAASTTTTTTTNEVTTRDENWN